METVPLKRRLHSIGGPESVRAHQRAFWTYAAARAVARGRDISPVTATLLEQACILPGMRVLDIACGTGEPAFAIAKQVGETGSVLAVDITAAMIDVAINLASERGIQNLSFRLIQNELEPESWQEVFDAITCRFGLMFVPDPAAAVASWASVLRSGARLAFCTHASLPAFVATMEVVEQYAPEVAEALQWRAPLSLSNGAQLEGILLRAGLEDIQITRERASHARGRDKSECWEAMVKRSALYDSLMAMPETTREAIRTTCLQRIRTIGTGPVEVHGEVLFASARKP